MLRSEKVILTHRFSREVTPIENDSTCLNVGATSLDKRDSSDPHNILTICNLGVQRLNNVF